VSPVKVIGLVVVAGEPEFHMFPSVLHSTAVIAAPPSLPTVKSTTSLPLPGVTDAIVGTAGKVAGVAVTPADAPEPTALRPRIETVYGVPLTNKLFGAPDSFVTTSGLPHIVGGIAAGGHKPDQVIPPSVEYS
jgi:hypothetical protein